MLVAACELRQVFACSDTHDLDYKMDLSLEEWKQVETLCKYVKYLLLAADLVTAPAYHTLCKYILSSSINNSI